MLSILDVLDQKQQAAKQARASGSVISNIKSQAAQIQVSMSTKQLFHIPLNRVQLLGMWLCEKAWIFKPRSVADMKRGGISKDIVLEMPLLITFSGGGVLLSHTLPGAVPLPCWVLASGFGMGPGVSPRP